MAIKDPAQLEWDEISENRSLRTVAERSVTPKL